MTSLVCEFSFLLNLPFTNLEWPAIFFVLPSPPSTGTSSESHSGFSWSCEPKSLLDKIHFVGDKCLFVCFGSWTCLLACQPKHHDFLLFRGRLFYAISSSWKWLTLSHGASSSVFHTQNDFSVLGLLRLFWWLVVWGKTLRLLLKLCIGHCCETHSFLSTGGTMPESGKTLKPNRQYWLLLRNNCEKTLLTLLPNLGTSFWLERMGFRFTWFSCGSITGPWNIFN